MVEIFENFKNLTYIGYAIMVFTIIIVIGYTMHKRSQKKKKSKFLQKQERTDYVEETDKVNKFDIKKEVELLEVEQAKLLGRMSQ